MAESGVSYRSQAYLPRATRGGSWQVGLAPGEERAAKVSRPVTLLPEELEQIRMQIRKAMHLTYTLAY